MMHPVAVGNPNNPCFKLAKKQILFGMWKEVLVLFIKAQMIATLVIYQHVNCLEYNAIY